MSVVHFEQLIDRISETAKSLLREQPDLAGEDFIDALTERAYATEEEINLALRINGIAVPIPQQQ